MKLRLMLVMALGYAWATPAAAQVRVQGTGATFPAPLYAR